MKKKKTQNKTLFKMIYLLFTFMFITNILEVTSCANTADGAVTQTYSF